jgi:hypothetical protein
MAKGKPRHKPPMTDLERAVWTLMSTDDYTALEQGDGHAVLIYIHGDPPQPHITLTMSGPQF